MTQRSEQRISVLIVEDDPGQRLTLVDLVEQEGFAVIACESAAQAIDRLRQRRFAVAIVDYNLPDASGTQLLNLIRERNPATRVIIHTGYGSFESAKDAVNLGAFAYVEKPHAPEELITTIHRAVEDHMARELEESQGRFQSIAENAPDVIVQLDRQGVITFINHDIPGLIGKERATVFDFICESAHDALRHALQCVFTDGTAQQLETTAIGPNGSSNWYDTRIGPVIVDDTVTSAVLIAHDISGRKRAEQALADRARQQAAVSELGRHALGGMPLDDLMRQAVQQVRHTLDVPYVKLLELMPRGNRLRLIAGAGWDRELLTPTTVDNTPNTHAGLTLRSREPVIVEDWAEETRCVGSPLLKQHNIVSGVCVVIEGTDKPFGVLCAHDNAPRQFTKDDVNFVQSVANVLADAVRQTRTSQALRESEMHYRQAAESNRRLLHEVNHRVRNNLAGLKSLLSLMRQRAGNVEDFAAAMDSRIHAMSRTHNMLAETGWRPVALRSLLNNLLSFTREVALHPIEVTLEGPPTPVSPRQSVPLAMSLMELFTNSCKHGAHRSPAGRLAVTWENFRENDRPWVRLIWRESGGPAIHGAIQPSLGTELVQGFVSFELGGRCELTFPPEGVRHTFEFAIDPPPRVPPPATGTMQTESGTVTPSL